MNLSINQVVNRSMVEVVIVVVLDFNNKSNNCGGEQEPNEKKQEGEKMR